MARIKTYDPELVLADAMEVFWECGFEATSIEDLAEATGLSRSSLYQEFGSKRGLFDTSLERYLERIDAMLSPLTGGSEGLDDIRAFLAMWKGLFEAGVDGSLGCLMVNTVAERGHIDETVAAAGRSYIDRLEAAFARPLRVAAERGEIAPGSAEQWALTFALLTTGIFVASRGQDRTRIEALLDHTIGVVEALRG